MCRKITALTAEQTAIADETLANDTLGSDVAARVSAIVRPVVASKFRSYVDDVGHITMLLLSLSGRLAKTENDLQALAATTTNAATDQNSNNSDKVCGWCWISEPHA